MVEQQDMLHRKEAELFERERKLTRKQAEAAPLELAQEKETSLEKLDTTSKFERPQTRFMGERKRKNFPL